jgi:hypothetical protein
VLPKKAQKVKFLKKELKIAKKLRMPIRKLENA